MDVIVFGDDSSRHHTFAMQLIKRGSALFKREKVAEGDAVGSQTPERSPSPSPASKQLLAPPGQQQPIPKLGETSDVFQTYSRAFKDLPVHKDLPRLAPNISLAICSESGVLKTLLPRATPPMDKTRRICDVLVALAVALDPQSEPLFRENSSRFITDPTSSAMIEFFKSVDDGTAPKHRTLRLLKAANQSIVAPILVDLQLNFTARKFPYSDGGKWDVEVVLNEKLRRVVLSHVRLERSTAALFAFQWRIVFIFDWEISRLLHVYYFIEGMNFTSAAEPQQIKELNELIKPIDIRAIETEVTAIWQKAHHQLPIHKDLPSVAPQVDLLPPLPPLSSAPTLSASQSALSSLELLLTQLTQRFSSAEKVAIVQTKFREVIQSQNVDQTLKSFLRDNLIVKDGERLTGVLKCLNTSIFAPVIIQLQSTIGIEYPFKDRLVPRSELLAPCSLPSSNPSSAINAWKITVDSSDAKSVMITHWKQEVTVETANPEKSFIFDWTLSLRFDSNVTHLEEVCYSLGDVVFHKDCSAATRESIRAALCWALRVQWWRE